MIIETKAINSKVLERNMNISVYIPKGYENINLPTLYFLHGRGGNENILKELEMDKVADKLIENHVINPLIIVCPYIANSRGINSSETYEEVQGKYGVVHKGLFEDYIVKEVISFIDNSYKTIKNKNSRYIGGISAGGYVALHIGFNHQDIFSKIGAHMPAIDLNYEDEDECYIACEKLYEILKSKNVNVENHIFKGHHNAEYIISNLEKYFKFYGDK